MDQWFFVGNERLMIENQILMPDFLKEQGNLFSEAAKTVVYFANQSSVKAILSISDQIKPYSKEAIISLKNQGIDVYMLTGDNNQTAKTIAQEVGIEFYQAEVMPQEKGDFVKKLQAEGKVVAMAGDGINDSHALAQADIGLAMGTGTDIAMESAGITLMNADLRQISKAIQLSKSTLKTIKQNLFWAFIYNIIAIPVAAGILYPAFGFLLNPMIAGAAMAMSSVSVVSNSLRLRSIQL